MHAPLLRNWLIIMITESLCTARYRIQRQGALGILCLSLEKKSHHHHKPHHLH